MNPQVVAEYGETVVINCTSLFEDYQEADGYLELSVTEWDGKVECPIQLNDSFVWKKEVDMVVYSKCHFQ